MKTTIFISSVCMKNVTAVLLMICGIVLLSWKKANTPKSSLHITIANIRNNKGICQVALYNNAATFLDSKKAVVTRQVSARKGVVTIEINNIDAGTYAVAVIHDENADNKLNTNFLGIPTEGYGASNNNLPKMSAPKFAASSFAISGQNIHVEIRLKY